MPSKGQIKDKTALASQTSTLSVCGLILPSTYAEITLLNSKLSLKSLNKFYHKKTKKEKYIPACNTKTIFTK